MANVRLKTSGKRGRLRYGRLEAGATLAVAAVAGLLVGTQPALAAEPAVSARLEVPEAETHVIGDPIQLFWHFTNATPKPLAFTWEACCRLNGRMTVKKDGVELPPIPPGPNSAHQFAKPAIIRAQGEQAFESQLADWVFLTNSGRYEISGRYVGVLPEQKPPVPPTISLWRGEVSTPPEAVILVTVDEYLAQRGDRVAKTGLDAAVTGPDRLPPLGEAPLTVAVTNRGTAPLKFRWPLEADLWFVDRGGIRVHRTPQKPTGDDEVVALPPGAGWSRTFTVAAADLGNAPFGDYRVFVDFAGSTNGRVRVPAKPVAVAWRLDAADVAKLLSDAASGSAIGARNPPLRVLRQHLAAIETTLNGLGEGVLSEKSRALRSQLATAAKLRDLPARVGRTDLRVRVSPNAGWSIDEPVVTKAIVGAAADQLRTVMGARRHLGLEVAANLQPEDSATVRDLALVSAELLRITSDLATAPRFIAEAPTNMVPGSLSVQPTAVPANFILRLQRQAEGSTKTSVARAMPGGMLKPEQFTSAGFEALAQPADVTARLVDGRLTAVQALVLASEGVTWRDLHRWIEPLLKRGLQVDLVAQP